MAGGNPQTLVWRSVSEARAPQFNNLECISRLSFFDLHNNWDVLRSASEEETIARCVGELLS